MNQPYCSRRELLARLGGGIAGVAFADLLKRNGVLAQSKSPLAPRSAHFPAKAKAVISIFCYGGVSQVDTFDPKPLLLKRQGEAMTGVGEVRPTMGTPGGLMPSLWKFRKHGQCGMDISELFPHVAEHADDLALIRVNGVIVNQLGTKVAPDVQIELLERRSSIRQNDPFSGLGD